MNLLFPCTVKFLVISKDDEQYPKVAMKLLRDPAFQSLPEGVCYFLTFLPGDSLECVMRHIQEAERNIKESLTYALQGGVQ